MVISSFHDYFRVRAAEIIECHQCAEVNFAFPYMAMNEVMKVARVPGVEIVTQVFDCACSMILRVELDHLDNVRNRLTDIDGLTFND